MRAERSVEEEKGEQRGSKSGSVECDEKGGENERSRGQSERTGETNIKQEWSNEETLELFRQYKMMGAKWVAISKRLPGRTEGEVKNKFYTTLKRVATQAQLENPVAFDAKFVKCKQNLLQFVDAAIQYNHLLPSKKGRKRNSDKLKARCQGLLFPKSPSLPMKEEASGYGLESGASYGLPVPCVMGYPVASWYSSMPYDYQVPQSFYFPMNYMTLNNPVNDFCMKL